MRKIGMAMVLMAATSLGACTTNDPYGYGRTNTDLGRAGKGAAIGAAAGAGVGAVVGGISPIEGAAVGAAAGAVIGAVTGNNRNWVRDQYNRCYYINDRGDRVYDYDRRC